MAMKYVLIFILNSANPTEQHTAQAWDKLFPSYDDCLKQASTIEVQNAILKDCKPVEVPGDGPPKEEVVLTPEPSVIEEPDQADAPAQPPKND
ncbi:hypothetical protein [Microvirga aerophila]|uniref:Uncharacterized protein n=1 Tax=Microvirga aerophila TaxID=670291 RepID=A0A512C463_9HYPH|nr:hypothetical protein [Microvirga aerophila]GEO18994.1 hypothetical protein MAE02_66900 [Microvirga aerophila]